MFNNAIQPKRAQFCVQLNNAHMFVISPFPQFYMEIKIFLSPLSHFQYDERLMCSACSRAQIINTRSAAHRMCSILYYIHPYRISAADSLSCYLRLCSNEASD